MSGCGLWRNRIPRRAQEFDRKYNPHLDPIAVGETQDTLDSIFRFHTTHLRKTFSRVALSKASLGFHVKWGGPWVERPTISY